MELTINYLVKSGLCLLALYPFYYAVLRNEPGFGLNRLYLLLAPAVALALPFTPWPSFLSTDALVAEAFPSIQLPDLVVTAYGSPNTAATYKSLLTLPNILTGAYIAGMLLLLFRLISQLLHVNRLISSGSRLQTAPADATLIQTNSHHPTFAFLHYIFLSEQPHLSAPEKKQVLAHELAHVKLLHTWDILYYEVLTALLWFNPMVWLLKNELRDVHEFQADARVISQHEARQYSALLAKEVLFKTGVPVGSYFREPQVFKRLQML